MAAYILAPSKAPGAVYKMQRLRALLDGPLSVLAPENLVRLVVRLLRVQYLLKEPPWRAYLQRRHL